VKFHFAQHKINDFTSKIDRLRSTLTSATVLALHCSSEANHQDVLTQLQLLQQEHTGNTDALQDTIRSLVDVVQAQPSVDVVGMNNLIQKCLEDINDIKRSLPQTRENEVLIWLSFRQMTFRYEEIPEAYKQTFSWLFVRSSIDNDKEWDDFGTYLEQDSTAPYFINGKAGSGKSTLMKYIVDHSETKVLLSNWASLDQKELFVVEFFFWKLGTPLQKTFVGLLRTVLFKVLQRYPELIPVVFPDMYQSYYSIAKGQEPIEVETRRALRLLLEKSKSFLKLAIFVDGVDEFVGDQTDLASFNCELAASGVKVVVSSRPINAALHAFRGCPSLRLQDITRNDMRLYVHDKLKAHSVMVQMANHHPEIGRKISEEILEKSQGVFLWVSLVIKLLVDGLEAGDDAEDLQLKLHSLPSNLRDLYRRMISDIPREYWSQSVEIFRTVQTWESLRERYPRFDPRLRQLDILMLHFATRPPLESINLAVGPLTAESLSWYCEQMAARLRSRSCGLLEICEVDSLASDQPKDAELRFPEVTYLHRTVGEFLNSDDVLAEMQSMARPGYDAHQNLVSAYLSMVKINASENTFDTMEDFTVTMLKSYQLCPSHKRTELNRYITALDAAMVEYFQNSSKDPSEDTIHWFACERFRSSIFGNCGYSIPTVPQSENIVQWTSPPNMLALAARLGFLQYLETAEESEVHTPLLVCFILDAWLGDPGLHVPLCDRRDTLLFLLEKLAKRKSRDLEQTIFQLAQDYGDASLQLDKSVLMACLAVGLGHADIWLEQYTGFELQSAIDDLRADEDMENQRLSIRLSQVMSEQASASHVCRDDQ
jgi:hypothetical protein